MRGLTNRFLCRVIPAGERTESQVSVQGDSSCESTDSQVSMHGDSSCERADSKVSMQND